MDGDGRRRPAGSASQSVGRRSPVDWKVYLLSGAGLVSILTGLSALSLPSGQEGELLWQLGPQQALYWMDVAGLLASLLGVLLVWVGGHLWRRSLRHSPPQADFTSSAFGLQSPER